MSGQPSPPTKAQLDKSDREHLEDVVTELRDTVEADIEYQLEHTYDLDDKDGGEELLGDKADVRSELVKAVEREDDDKSWEEKFERYVMGVGYTIINRLTALRCMEVRGFIERPVTQFGDSGTTPAAEKLENEQYLAPDEAKIEAYDEACRKLTDEIEILFDPESPYSIVDPDVSVFEELCRKLDGVPQEVWRADDVLGWVYEYYNASKLDELRRKGDREGLEPEDVPPANQFYTPHWVVRMLTDNSLAKMYLESKGELISTVEEQKALSADDRKYRDTAPSVTPSLADFSTYLVPTEKEGKSSSFEDPQDIRVIDPACGSGHFLLYAFDVLERIWHIERPELNRSEIPQKILQNNLYGVDLDLRACQLAAFNLYLKARGRAEDEGATEFEMPEVGIVCADTKIASVESATEVFDEVAGEQPEVREALEDILDAFEGVQGLGSLLDVKGTLEEKFSMEEQPTLMEAIEGPGSLTNFLTNLHQEVAAHRNGDSFMAQDLRSFLRVLVILSQDYDVALMNPPYGARNRMPDTVKDYVEDHYKYTPEFYINFFEVCDRLAKENGRIGMLVPRSFMFKRSFEDFRKDFFEERGAFDFLAEYGLGILDNATVRTVGTVVRKKGQKSKAGRFLRLHDADTEEKERVFLDAIFSEHSSEVQRLYKVDNSEFKKVPGYPISYWTPPALRQLHESEKKIDADAAGVEGNSIAKAAKGMDTGNNQRFLRSHWEVPKDGSYIPYAKGGSDAWIMPRVELTLLWGDDGSELARSDGALLKNSDFYGRDGVTWTYAKETGRRFGYFPSDGAFDGKGSMIFTDEVSNWSLISVLNSALYHGLFLSLTPERDWQVGDVGRIPWLEPLESLSELKNISKEQYQLFINSRVNDPTSPYYIGPAGLPEINEFFWGNHIYAQNQEKNEIDLPSFEGMSFEERANATIKSKRERQLKLHELADKADQLIFEELGINSQTQEETLTEIKLRTSKDPKDPNLDFPESLEETPELLAESIKETVHHLALDSILSQDDGILPITDISDNKASIFDTVEQQFIDIFDEVAQDRLEEVDNVLGDRTPDHHPYPNLKNWLENELFEYHIETFGNKPIVWKLTTDRLVSDSKQEAFSCYISYYETDASIFDRIESGYVEPLKTEYRSRRSAADQRRSDSSLTTNEQAEAAEKYERYESALTQLNAFQNSALELSSPHSIQIDESVETIAENLKPKVELFRKQTAERLETLDELVEEMDEDEFEDHFSPTFLERVNDNRDEWLGALANLELACEAYSDEDAASIKAHLYDLFPYFSDLVGTTHYGSHGIFFMNYYFSKGENFLDAGEPREGLEGVPKLLAELAAETDKDVELGEEIKEACSQLSKALPSDWEDRALEEVLSSGYNPVKKHGVAINIQPLAEQNLMPESVEDQVL